MRLIDEGKGEQGNSYRVTFSSAESQSAEGAWSLYKDGLPGDYYEKFPSPPNKSASVAAPPTLSSTHPDTPTPVVGRRKVKGAGAYVFRRRRRFPLRVAPLATPDWREGRRSPSYPSLA